MATGYYDPEWPVLKTWLQTGDCVVCVYTTTSDWPYIGLGTVEEDGIYIRCIVCPKYASHGTRKLPAAQTAIPAGQRFVIDRLGPHFVPKERIKEIVFYDPIHWRDYLLHYEWDEK